MMDDGKVALAISTAGLVTATYGAALPSMAAVRDSADTAGHYAAAQRYAAVTSIACVIAIGAVTRSWEVAAIGTVTTVAMASAYSRAHAAEPTPR